MTPLQHSLLEWYRTHHRALPWRMERDPYRILLSEVLLQQTRVDQAIPYYHRFLERFPDLCSLGKAELEEVLRVWQGAGYYARARNLHKLAQVISAGTAPEPLLPSDYARLRKLPGLGPYTAAAVASIAFGEPVAAVDGNVRRVISRLMAWETPTPTELQAKAEGLLATESPGEWNQAMMELGATLCTPQKPACTSCPLARWCAGQASPERYPAPRARPQKAVEAVALVLQGPYGVLLEPRQGRSLGGLWGVPMAEGHSLEPLLGRLAAEHGTAIPTPEHAGRVQHAFTHRRLTVQVYKSRWEGPAQDPRGKPLSQLDRKILRQAQAL
ncbi:A/G-specific adenine glycosylase [Calidithermus timidus]|uniref:A/G-specific adenine glycosylase n=1 Tax=Calidithermus timidus TaxID=307124 RepID=UPI0003813F69|nr:A/G-specific adenine glycosylase [Calidithermus timidus]